MGFNYKYWRSRFSPNILPQEEIDANKNLYLVSIAAEGCNLSVNTIRHRMFKGEVVAYAPPGGRPIYVDVTTIR